MLQQGFQESPTLSYQTLTQGKSRKTAAVMFLEMLVLTTQSMLEVEQAEPYADITLHRTEALMHEVVQVDA